MAPREFESQNNGMEFRVSVRKKMRPMTRIGAMREVMGWHFLEPGYAIGTPRGRVLYLTHHSSRTRLAILSPDELSMTHRHVRHPHMTHIKSAIVPLHGCRIVESKGPVRVQGNFSALISPVRVMS